MSTISLQQGGVGTRPIRDVWPDHWRLFPRRVHELNTLKWICEIPMRNETG